MKHKIRKTVKKCLAMVLCLCMIFPSTGIVVATAEETSTYTGGCPHHTEHTPECGYVEAREEKSCQHEHTNECYVKSTEGMPCTHEHTDECFEWVTKCVHEHTDECYVENSVSEHTETLTETEEQKLICDHVCSEESGCITKKDVCKHEHDSECGYGEGTEEIICNHVHDEFCGYEPAVEGSPCSFMCEICSSSKENSQEKEQLWYREVYYQFYDSTGNLTDENGATYNWIRQKFEQGGWSYPDETVSISHEKFDGEEFAWDAVDGSGKETLGVHYVFDENYGEHRLSDLCSEATKTNPLKIYYRAAPHTVTYQYEGDVPAGAPEPPKVVNTAYSAPVTVAAAPTLQGYTFSGWKVKAPENVAIADGELIMPNADVVLTGKWEAVPTEPEKATGSLVVSKTVAGNDGEREKEFHFTVSLSDPTILGTYGEMEFKEGVATFSLKHQESKSGSGLPAGVTYRVTEKEANQDGYTTTATGATGEIKKDQRVTATFTNTREIIVPVPATGSLVVSKTVAGNDGEREKEFHFTVSLSDPTISGTYGEMEFKEGVATFSLKHQESKSGSGLPAGVTYRVTEKEANQDGYTTTATGATGEIKKDQRVTATFTNTREIIVPVPATGSLVVSKTVAGNDGEREKEFHFTVSLSDPTISGTYGEMEFKEGVATFSLKHQESKSGSGLPAGVTYRVTEKEADQDGYTTTATGATGEIKKDQRVTATFTNTREIIVPVPATGSLVVSKTVAGNDGEREKEFHFTVSLSDPTISGTYGEMEFKEGVATFSLKHQESKSGSGLPAGVTYRVTEKEANQDGYTTTATGATGEIKKDQRVTATFTNTREIIVPVPATGSLVVSKTVAGNDGEREKEFHFTVSLSDPTISGTYGEMEFKEGVATFSLKHQESKSGSGLPAGVTYRVTEKEADQDGYTTTATGATGEIKKDQTVMASFQNYREDNYIDVTVKKIWKLDNDGTATDSVTIVLCKNGKKYDTVELSEENNWSYTWHNLSNRYTWTVEEREVPEGFTAKVSQKDYTFTIVNDDNSSTQEKPNQSDKPDTPGTLGPTGIQAQTGNKDTIDDVPKTGDTTNLALWLCILATSGVGLVITLILEKKKHIR